MPTTKRDLWCILKSRGTVNDFRLLISTRQTGKSGLELKSKLAVSDFCFITAQYDLSSLGKVGDRIRMGNHGFGVIEIAVTGPVNQIAPDVQTDSMSKLPGIEAAGTAAVSEVIPISKAIIAPESTADAKAAPAIQAIESESWLLISGSDSFLTALLFLIQSKPRKTPWLSLTAFILNIRSCISDPVTVYPFRLKFPPKD